MGMYCCCNQRIKNDGEWECLCDWSGWISTMDFPSERKNKDIPIQEQPLKDGRYLARFSNDSGDRYEVESNFTLKPISTIDIGYLTKIQHDVHWDEEGFDGIPYAWKEIK